MRLLPCGDRAILIELDDAAERRQVEAALRAHPVPGVLEHVPGARTVLVRAGATDLASVAAALRRLPLTTETRERRSEREVQIPVRYDGADLAEVAEHLGIDTAAVVARHTGQSWTVEFAGFAPGFVYLVGDQGGLEVPRHATPRTRIPAGSVALAGPYSGVYPTASPGGWQLIGSTDTLMWDSNRAEPALLAPGARVRFVALDEERA